MFGPVARYEFFAYATESFSEERKQLGDFGILPVIIF